MFDDMIESTSGRKGTRKTWTVFVSLVIQVILVGILVLIPLIYTQALPKTMLTMMITAPPPPAPPPPPPPPAEHIQVVKPTVRLLHNGELTAPRAIPKQVTMVKEEAMPPDDSAMGAIGGVPGGVEGGDSGGVIGGVLGGIGPAAPPPPKAAVQRIRLGGNVLQAKLISEPMPTYPPLARQARIQGNVVLHAIISKDGHVEQLSVISGHPLLIQAALDAVRQWRYQPTMLNGDPVEVDTTITVTFTMGE
jgi:protein TonB